MKVYSLLGNFIDADVIANYLIPSYPDHILLGFFSVSIFLYFNSLFTVHFIIITILIFIFRALFLLHGIANNTLTAYLTWQTVWRTVVCWMMLLYLTRFVLNTNVCLNFSPSLRCTSMASSKLLIFRCISFSILITLFFYW